MLTQIQATLILAILPIAGCGAGGSSGDVGSTGALAQQTSPDPIVVQYDRNGDGQTDWVALDPTTSPMQIIEAMDGVIDGDPIDVTDLVLGTPIDADISAAIAEHRATSFDVSGYAELEIQTATATTISVVVLD